MDREKNKLRLGYPQDRNQVFEVVAINPLHIVLRDSRGCYIGFSADGELVKPCSLTQEDRRALLVLRMVHFNKPPRSKG